MTLLHIIGIIVFCAVATVILYGLYLLEDDRHQYRKKHGVDPKYHGWDLEKNDTDQGDGKK